jgi:hypothetical protein
MLGGGERRKAQKEERGTVGLEIVDKFYSNSAIRD